MEIAVSIVLLALVTGGTNGYVYTCEEVKYKVRSKNNFIVLKLLKINKN